MCLGDCIDLSEIDLPRKAYYSLCNDTASCCTDTASCGADTASYCTDRASCGTDTVSYGTDTVSYGTDTTSYFNDTASYGTSGIKGLPWLCSVLPPASNFGVLCCTATKTVFNLIHCTTTRTTFSELPQALSWSVIVFSVTRAVISLLPNTLWCHSLLAFDILFPGAITMTRLAFLDAVVCELLATAAAHVDKHIWPARQVIMCATFVVYLRSIVFGPLS